MGRRWRSKLPQQIQELAPDMIEHSINKYTAIIEQSKSVVSYIHKQQHTQHPSTKTNWPKHKCLEYIEAKKKEGFILKAEVMTSYGNPGTINTIREIPEEGLSFFGLTFPNIYTIYRPLHGDSGVFYNESELTLKNK
jgi:hypothetical protein